VSLNFAFLHTTPKKRLVEGAIGRTGDQSLFYAGSKGIQVSVQSPALHGASRVLAYTSFPRDRTSFDVFQ
jgi:hypothetical protein